MAAVIHELGTHQVELTIQNEALREAQTELESSRSRYRDLYELAPVSYLTLTADGSIRDANLTAQQFFRKGRRELVGQRLSRFVAAPDVAKFAGHRRSVLASDEQLRCDLALELDQRHCEVRLESVRTGSSDDWRTAIIDLTDLHHFERSARERAFLSAVLDTAGLLVVLDPAGRIARANAACLGLVGDAAEMGSRFWEVFATPAARADLQRDFEAFVRTGERGEWECAVPGTEGRERIVSWSSSLLRDTAGEVEYVITSGNDLTDRRRLESQLVVADRLAAMGTLAAGVGHEINNPLAYAMISLERASKIVQRTRAQLPPECDALGQLLATALEGADRIRSIVEDMRSLTGRSSGASEWVDVHTVLDSCLRVADSQIRHRAEVLRDYQSTRMVQANRARLSQVFLNLILNAAQAIPEGRSEGNTIRFHTHDHFDDRVIVVIQDSGVGIEPDDLARIFDPFFTTKAQGTGLGLSICYEIVTRIGGKIVARSKRGDGTRFELDLPGMPDHGPAVSKERSRSERECARSERERARSEHSIDILVVEDEAQLARSLAQLLNEHRVTIANNGRQALEACKKTQHALILCDVLMPDLSGPQIHNELAHLYPGREKSIVFMTGGAFTTQASEALSRLPNRILQKPFELAELLEIVAEHVPEPAASAQRNAASFKTA